MIATLLLAVSATVWSAGDSLYGTVRVTGTGERVAGVRVVVQGRLESVVSDSAGLYVLRDIPAGRLHVRFERLGFEPLGVSVMLPDAGAARVDVDLAPVPITLPPVTVLPDHAAAPPPIVDASEIGLERLTPALAGRNPLVGESDVFGALAAAPSINGREELAPSLHVRGGAGDENLVLVDGIPWRGPRPLGGIAGLLPSGAVAAVDFHTAAPPARYGEALSSVVAVHTRAVNHVAVEGNLDPSIFEQTLGGPLPLRGASVLLSARGTYRAVFGPPNGVGESDNGFNDAVGRLSLPAGPGRLDLYYLGGRDRLTFPATVGSTSNAMNGFSGLGLLAGAVWTRALEAGRNVHMRVWSSEVAGHGVWGTWGLASSLRDVGVSGDYGDDRSEVGFTVSKTATRYHVQDSTRSGFALDGAAIVAAAFVSRRWNPTPFWTVSTGMRVGASPEWGAKVEPRLWTRIAFGSHASASLGYARTHQYVQSARNEESILDALMGADLPVAAGSGGLPPARADQFTAAVEARLGAHTGISVAAYTRWLSGLALVAPTTGLPFSVGVIAVGRGAASGGDATLTIQSRHFDVRAQVSVLRSDRTVDTVRYHPNDAQDRVAVGLAYHFSERSVIRLALGMGVGRSTTVLRDNLFLDPYAPLDGAGELAGSPTATSGPLNGARLPPYARVDLAFSRDWDFDRVPRFNTSLTISNLLDRHNILVYVGTPNGPQPVLLLPRTLSMRVRWSLGSRL